MGLFKKLGKGVKRVIRKNRGGAARLVKKVGPGLVLSAVTGGVAAPLVAKAASAAKTLGKKVKGIETPKSLVPVFRAASKKRKKDSVNTRMPGGAPVRDAVSKYSSSLMHPSADLTNMTLYTGGGQTRQAGKPRVGMMSSRPQAKRTLYTKAKKPRAPRVKKSTAKNAGKPPRVWSPAQIAAREAFAARMRKKKSA